MKKVLTFFLCVNIIILSFATPFSAFAKDRNNDEGMYRVSDKIYADAYMLVNLDDDSYPVIAQKNKDKRKYPASLTKMVTTMVVLNNVKDLNAKTKVSQSAIDAITGLGAQNAGLKVGEEVTIEQLLYLTMVFSACDACQVLAEYVSGNVTEFAKLMNNWVKSLGCKDTNFTNPDGLHDANHYTTASDMLLITLESMKNETFMKMATTQKYTYGKYTFTHTNYMMDKPHRTYYYPYAQGIKTGSTEEAGYCVITKASKDGYNYLAIVMDSPLKKLEGYDTKYSFIDAKTLFEWGFNSLKHSMVLRKNDVVSEIPVASGKDADTLPLVAQKDVLALVPKSLDPSAVMIKPVDQPESVDAPIAQGDKICEADIIYAEKVIAHVNLVAGKTVELSTLLKFTNGIKKILGKKSVLAVVIILIIAVIIYIFVFIDRMNKAKKASAAKRRRREELEEQVNREYHDRNYIPPPRR
ncbi:MAG: D-alanyl-D-alanine carboxypeptidase [Eubacterium sp.]|nr:D-alanyl-D-alanine carboxypeptidase [Eubacterium sp.]